MPGPLMRLSAKGRQSFNDAVDWIRSTMIPQETAGPLARLQRTAEIIPEAYELYDPYALMSVHTAPGTLARMDPGRFEELAYPLLNELDPFKMLRARRLIGEGAPLNDTPFLYFDPPTGTRVGGEELPGLRVTGHEGRHRNRALAENNLPSLVHLLASPMWGGTTARSRGWERTFPELQAGRMVMLPEGYSPSNLERGTRALQTDPWFQSSGWYPRPPLKAGDIFESMWRRGGHVA